MENMNPAPEEILNIDEAPVVQSENVIIENEVLAEIACYAAAEVEGVAEVAGLKTRDIKSKFGFKNAPNGVKIDKTEEGLVIYLAIIIDSRHSIPETTAKLRERIKQTLEAMTDNDVKAVNIKISGVHVESEQD
jgi:uncharacterized alkaline shock family protein YloU